MNDETFYPQLRIKEFQFENGSDLVIPLSPGFNILHGHNQAYRTFILRLIRYGLGAKAIRLDINELKALDNVKLNFYANGEEIRAVRSCQTPTGLFNVYDSLDGHKFNRFLAVSCG